MLYADLQRAVDLTRAMFGRTVPPRENPDATTYLAQKAHCLWMLNEIQGWRAERLDKAFRWLGFVQGWLWSSGLMSVAQAQSANRPEARAEESTEEPAER